MSDPDPTQPPLPDPKHDRHVAFPDAPTGSGPRGPRPDGGERLATPRSGAPAHLPPEAWAPRPGELPPAGDSPAIPRPSSVRHAGHPRGPVARPRWLRLLFVVPILFGVVNHAAHEQVWGGSSVAVPMGAGVRMDRGGHGPESGPGVWTTGVDDPSSFAPPLSPSQAVVPVPVDAKVLRVEIVSASGGVARAETTAGGSPVETLQAPLPLGLDVHLDLRPADVSVTATRTDGSGDLQCRVYAGDRLVAIDTAATSVTCTPRL